MNKFNKLHDLSMDKAFEADQEKQKGNSVKALDLFSEAYSLEKEAIQNLNSAHQPTWSIAHRSLASLALESHKYASAFNHIEDGLKFNCPQTIREELKELLLDNRFQRAYGYLPIGQKDSVDSICEIFKLMAPFLEKKFSGGYRPYTKRLNKLYEKIKVR